MSAIIKCEPGFYVVDQTASGINVQISIDDILGSIISFAKDKPDVSQALCTDIARMILAPERGFDARASLSRQACDVLSALGDITPVGVEMARLLVDDIQGVIEFESVLDKLREVTKCTEGEELVQLLYEEFRLRTDPDMFELGLFIPRNTKDQSRMSMEYAEMDSDINTPTFDDIKSAFGKLANWDRLTIQQKNEVQSGGLPQLWVAEATLKSWLAEGHVSNSKSWFNKMLSSYRDECKQDSLRWLRETDRWPRRHFDISVVTELIEGSEWSEQEMKTRCDIRPSDCLVEWAARLMVRVCGISSRRCSPVPFRSNAMTECNSQDLNDSSKQIASSKLSIPKMDNISDWSGKKFCFFYKMFKDYICSDFVRIKTSIQVNNIFYVLILNVSITKKKKNRIQPTGIYKFYLFSLLQFFRKRTSLSNQQKKSLLGSCSSISRSTHLVALMVGNTGGNDEIVKLSGSLIINLEAKSLCTAIAGLYFNVFAKFCRLYGLSLDFFKTLYTRALAPHTYTHVTTAVKDSSRDRRALRALRSTESSLIGQSAKGRGFESHPMPVYVFLVQCFLCSRYYVHASEAANVRYICIQLKKTGQIQPGDRRTDGQTDRQRSLMNRVPIRIHGYGSLYLLNRATLNDSLRHYTLCVSVTGHNPRRRSRMKVLANSGRQACGAGPIAAASMRRGTNSGPLSPHLLAHMGRGPLSYQYRANEYDNTISDNMHSLTRNLGKNSSLLGLTLDGATDNTKKNNIYIIGDQQVCGLTEEIRKSRSGKWNDNYNVTGIMCLTIIFNNACLLFVCR
ncbi:hypothetical protein ABMA28_013141 [Loxostege sticticalis]|uniref:Uncharacterized protein n=1 Tax=Loxostege sticticalis TaxID=481309 RepID=A0ABD0S7M5_LOXSC